MKKAIITFVLVTLLGVGSMSAQLVWGIRAGISIPSLSMKTSGDGESYSDKLNGLIGLEIGPTAYLSFGEKLYLNVAALYSMKRFDVGDGYTATLHYAEVPAYLGYRIPIGSNVETYLQAGPYLGIKLAEGVSGPDNDLSGESSGFNTLDAGLALMYGVNINRFKIEVGVKFGLTNLTSGSDWNGNEDGYTWSTTTHITSPFLGISYVF
ncbi:MAG: PorT family protein [Paludibacter sp.]|nr:PorT family protein [Paludibacter sp.]